MPNRNLPNVADDMSARDAWTARLAAWRRYDAWEQTASPVRSAGDLLEAATWLYDLLPAQSRVRAIDPSGVARMRACLSVLGRSR